MSAWSDRHPIRGHQCSLEASPLTPFGTSSRTCAKREIGIERSLRAGGEHRPDLSGRCRVRRRAPRSYANVFHRRGRLCGVDTDVRQRTAVPWRRRVLGTRNRGGPELVPRLSGGHIHQRLEDVLWMSRDRDLSPSIERRRRDVGRGPTRVARARPGMAVRSANQGRSGRDRVRRLPADVRSRERPVQVNRPWGDVVRPIHDERRASIQRQADPRRLSERQGCLCRLQRQARIIRRSLPRRRANVPQVKTSNESLWWYSYGGTYAPDGDVYFAQAGEAGAKTNGKRTNQGHTDGIQKIFVLKMNHEGTAWENVYIDTSMVSTPCAVPGCYGDYFAAQAAIAADADGKLILAYTRNDVNGTAHKMYLRTSSDGVAWSSAALFNDQGDSNFPAIVAGPTAGDFRLAWQDNRNAVCWDCGGLGSWNTWYARTTNGGGTWTASVRLSSLGSGAPYKTPQGYAFPGGDYFGLAVDSSGTNHLIWGEADGSSLYCCGGAWYTRGA